MAQVTRQSSRPVNVHRVGRACRPRHSAGDDGLAGCSWRSGVIGMT